MTPPPYDNPYASGHEQDAERLSWAAGVLKDAARIADAVVAELTRKDFSVAEQLPTDSIEWLAGELRGSAEELAEFVDDLNGQDESW